MFLGLAFAQGWTEYVSREDFFSVSFPGEPTVEDITYAAEYRISLPGRVHSIENRRGRYSVTVVNYADAVEIHQERIVSCTAAGGDGDSCQDDGPEEVRGAIVYASWNFINRDGVDVTHYAHYNSDRVEGHEIHLTNADQSRTFAVVHMHENRLYILEATVPPGALRHLDSFQVSVRFLDEAWNPVRYSWVGTQLYSNGYPPPPRTRCERGPGPGAAADG